MSANKNTVPSLQAASLEDVKTRIDGLLRKHREGASADSEWREDVCDALAQMHKADIADLLERVPQAERALLWADLPLVQISGVLPEVSENLCETLVELTPTETMVSVLHDMDADEIGWLMRELPKNDAARLMRLANLVDNTEVRASLSFASDSVGALMDYQPTLVREKDTVNDIRLRLQEMGELPSHCDKLFVVDDWERLVGVMPLKRLLLNTPTVTAAEIMISQNLHTFLPDDDAEEAAGAFERYNLISAPVLNAKYKVIGRITIDEIFEHVHSQRDIGLLNSAGVLEEEDLFASLWHRFGNRWRWLFVNLIAVFLISRVVGLFEGAIVQLVALASLMPIVAGMSGNVGNQTATLTVRALALDKINNENWKIIMRNEAMLALVNGVVWGTLTGIFIFALYQRLDLVVVLVSAMTFCFFAGAITGVFVPVLMQKIGRDPAVGTTVVISAVTDTLGFFVFLGMGALFLL